MDRSGKPVWAPYSEANLAEFENIIQQSEIDWYREGVTDYRIENRITTMKLFYDTWDMNRLYLHVKNGKFGEPKYMLLNDAEMRLSSVLSRSTASKVIGTTRSSRSAWRIGRRHLGLNGNPLEAQMKP